jgi:hypothetical protein
VADTFDGPVGELAPPEPPQPETTTAETKTTSVARRDDNEPDMNGTPIFSTAALLQVGDHDKTRRESTVSAGLRLMEDA